MLDIESHVLQHGLFVIEVQHRAVMAVRLHQRLATELRHVDLLVHDELGERHGRLAQTARVLVAGEEVRQLVAEHRRAARLEHDDRQAFVQLRLERLHRLAQQLFGHAEEAPVVERASAAELLARQGDVVADIFQYFDRRHRGIGVEVIVERVGPQQDAPVGLPLTRRFAPPSPRFAGRGALAESMLRSGG